MEYSVSEVEHLMATTATMIEESITDLQQGKIDKACSGLQSMALLASLHGRLQGKIPMEGGQLLGLLG